VLGVLLALACASPAGAISPTITEFSDGFNASDDISGLAAGPDGNLWFGLSAGAIGRMTPSGTVTRFSGGLRTGASPNDITAGPDGNLWFTDTGAVAIGRVTTGGAIQEFSNGLNPGADHLTDITRGPDGNLWFTDLGSPAIGRVTPSGTIHEFDLDPGSQPFGIAAGPDGNLWFTDDKAVPAIGRMTPSGDFQEFSTGLNPGSQPAEIAAGPDGNLWFTDQGTEAAVGRITTAGQITEFPAAPAFLFGIASGPDGALWVGNEGVTAGSIARVLPGGDITSFNSGLNSGANPAKTALGPDGNMWFTDIGAKPAIGRITTPPTVTTVSATATGATTAAILGLVDGHAQATTFHVEYGAVGGSITSTAGQSLGTTVGPTRGTAALTRLRPSTTYQARIIGVNSTDSSAGAFLTFTTPPATDRITRMRLRPRVFVAATHGGPVRGARAAGALITYTGTQPATTTFTIERATLGRRAGRNCVKRNRRNRKRKTCVLYVKTGSFKHTDKPGRVRFRFTGRLHNRTLRVGRYRLSAEPHSAGGVGHIVRKHFGVKPAPHKKHKRT
jgi:virginiamycin B lyase